MKSITIRQLHDEPGRGVRRAAALGGLHVTERGKTVARIVPATATPTTPYFSRRILLPAFQATKFAGGSDSTSGISAERDER